MSGLEAAYARAAALIEAADGLLVTAGAGMGVEWERCFGGVVAVA